MPLDSSSAKDWIFKAENDLKAAKAIFEYYEEPPTDTICYHCHQVAEKGLKSILVQHGAERLKVHDLVELLNFSCQYEPSLEILRKEIEDLNSYYIEAKYPLDQPIAYPIEEARQAIQKAELVLAKVQEAK